ncbi:MAG: 3'-5' exonuclease [Actinomycetota bacterium]
MSHQRRRVGPIDTTSPPLIGLDIETDTSIDGLDPRCSPVVALALSSSAGEWVFDHEDEAALLRAADDHIASLESGVLVTWNGSGFDLPFITDRAHRLGLTIGLHTVHDPALPGQARPLPGHPGRVRGRWHRLAHLDGYQAFRADVGQNLPISCGLKSLARFVGLPVVEVDRTRIHELTAQQRHDYVASDARLARALVERRADRAAWVDQSPSSRGS